MGVLCPVSVNQALQLPSTNVRPGDGVVVVVTWEVTWSHRHGVEVVDGVKVGVTDGGVFGVTDLGL